MKVPLERVLIEFLTLLITFALIVDCNESGGESNNYSNKEWFKIEGKVQAPDSWAKTHPDWKLHTQVLIDGGEYRAYLRYMINTIYIALLL